MSATKTLFGIACGLALGLGAIGGAVRLFRAVPQAPAVVPESIAATAPPTHPPIAPLPPPPAPPSIEEVIDEHARHIASLEGDALIAELEDFAARSSEATYPMLERNADAWIGEPAVFSGTIAQIQDEPGVTIIRLATASYGQRIVWVETAPSCVPDRTLVANARVRVYGYLAGNHTYESQAGWNITLPALVAVAVARSSMPSHLSARRRAELGLDPVPSLR